MDVNHQYAVYLFLEVRVKVGGVMAQSPVEAMKRASDAVDLVDFHELLDNHNPKCDVLDGMTVEYVEFSENGIESALVDPLLDNNEVDYGRSIWLDQEGNAAMEAKAKSCDRLECFMQELQDSVESLTGIAEVYGVRTLVDLLYLSHAIVREGFIDCDPEESRVLEVIKDLPSSEQWRAFIKPNT